MTEWKEIISFSAMFKNYNVIYFSDHKFLLNFFISAQLDWGACCLQCHLLGLHPSPEEGGYMLFHHVSYFVGSNLEAIWIYLVKSGFPGFLIKGFRGIIRSAMERRSILNTVFGHLEPKCDHNSFGHLQKCKVGSTQLLNTICLDDQD